MRPNKRGELIRKSLDLFYRNGFHATGMDMIAAETGVSKTSIYKHFRTKEDLILAVLRLRDEEFRNWLYRRIEELADTPRDQMLAMFDALAEWFERRDFRGCMFVKASAEFQEYAHPIHAQSAEHKRLLLEYVADLARKAGAADPETLARQLTLLKEGAIVIAVMGHGAQPARDASTAAASLLALALD